MAKARSTSMSRRTVVAGLALSAAPAALAGADRAYAQAQQTKSDKSLYDRLGGVFAIAAVDRSLQRRRRKKPCRRSEVEKPAAEGMAHQEPDKAARPQVPADPVGLQRVGRTVPVHGYQTRHDAARPRGGPSRLADLAGRIRRGRSRTRSVAGFRQRCRSARRAKCWQPSPPTRTKSPRATPRPPSAAEAHVRTIPPAAGGIAGCAPTAIDQACVSLRPLTPSAAPAAARFPGTAAALRTARNAPSAPDSARRTARDAPHR